METPQMTQQPWRLNQDFALFPEVTQVHSGKELEGWNNALEYTELMHIQMRRYRTSPTVGLLENKLLGNQVLEQYLNLPVQDVIYGGFALRPLGRWPRYERKEFVDVMSSYKSHNFVVKPLTNAGSAGVLVMNSEKWVKGNWTIDKIADHVESFFVGKDYSTMGQQYERRGVVVQTSFLDDNADISPGNFHSKETTGVNLELKVLVVFGELTSARVETLPWSGDNHIDTSFCDTSQTEKGELPLLKAEGIDAPEVHFRKIKAILKEHQQKITEFAKRSAEAYGGDMIRLDLFITESGRLVINELTYPSFVGLIDICSPNRLFRGYQGNGEHLKLTKSSEFIKPMLNSIGVDLQEFLEFPDYVDLWHRSEEDYDNSKWGYTPDDEAKTGWLQPKSWLDKPTESYSAELPVPKSVSVPVMLRKGAGSIALDKHPHYLPFLSLAMLVMFCLRHRYKGVAQKCEKST